jgi:hypothetical protein
MHIIFFEHKHFTFNPLRADVIGQVVERDELKEKDVNGRRSKLMDLTLQDSEYVV